MGAKPKREGEKFGTEFSMVGLNPNHKKWLKEHQDFNLSRFVRESLDKEIKKEKKRSEQ